MVGKSFRGGAYGILTADTCSALTSRCVPPEPAATGFGHAAKLARPEPARSRGNIMASRVSIAGVYRDSHAPRKAQPALTRSAWVCPCVQSMCLGDQRQVSLPLARAT